MKCASIVLFFLTLFTSVAIAADKPEKGFKRHHLSPTVTIDLPKKWALASYPMPIPGASNYRIDTGKLRMAITGFPTPTIPEGAKNPTLSEGFVKDTAIDSSKQYLQGSNEKEVMPIVLSGRGYALAHATFSSATGEAIYPAFYARTYACVSTGMVNTTLTVYSITIGSNDCNGKEHKAALTALSTIIVGG
jgi:hypothetical protein